MKFIKAGIYSSFQNEGIYGYQDRGIPIGGAMDLFSFKLLNIILNNNINETAVECHFPGPKIFFEEDAIICITGADFNPKIDNESILLNKEYRIKANSELRFSNKIHGERCYIGFKGGIAPEFVPGVHLPNKISNDLKVKLNGIKDTDILISKSGVSLRNNNLKTDNFELLFVPQNEYFELSQTEINQIVKSTFIVSNSSNRMGIRLEAMEKLPFLFLKDLISSPVSKGTIQLPFDGNPVILMADAQVTGGYFRLGFVPIAILNQLSQKKAGTKINFRPIDLEKGIQINEEESSLLEKIKRYFYVGRRFN